MVAAAATAAEAVRAEGAEVVAAAEEARRSSLPVVPGCRCEGLTLRIALLRLDIERPTVGGHDRRRDCGGLAIDSHDDLVTLIREPAVGIRQHVVHSLHGIVLAVEAAAPLHVLNAPTPPDHVVDNAEAFACWLDAQRYLLIRPRVEPLFRGRDLLPGSDPGLVLRTSCLLLSPFLVFGPSSACHGPWTKDEERTKNKEPGTKDQQ